MATLYEQSICQNTRCFACGSLVYAVEKKMTTNHIYHNRCFRCRICKRNLTGYSLNEEGDDIYCENCYRKKQRGDCNSLEFYRAAAEKAQYVHNRHHPDLQQTLSHHPRHQSNRDVARHPSLTLRQLERQFLSCPQPNNNHNHEQTNEINQKLLSPSQPLTINTSFSTPINLTKYHRDSSLTKDEPSPYFAALFSPVPNIRTETIIRPRITLETNKAMTDTTHFNEQNKPVVTSPTGSATGGIEFRLNKSSIDLTNVTSPQTNRKSIIIPDLNQNDEQQESKMRFQDFNITSTRYRSSSANRLMDAIRVD